MRKTSIIIMLLWGLQGCSNSNTNVLRLPETCSNIGLYDYSFVFHFDLEGCFSCSASVGGVERFISLIKEQFNTNFGVLIILHATNEEATFMKNSTQCPYDIFVDENNSFAKKNDIIYNPTNICYLINNQKEIIWQGNPIRIKENRKDVCKQLADLLSVEMQEFVDGEKIELGTFNWKTEQHTTFSIHNTSNEPMLIDTVFTSCECTIAEINEHNIAPADSAIVSVSFKAEKPEQFVREVYVGVRGKEQIVLSIEGEAVK